MGSPAENSKGFVFKSLELYRISQVLSILNVDKKDPLILKIKEAASPLEFKYPNF